MTRSLPTKLVRRIELLFVTLVVAAAAFAMSSGSAYAGGGGGGDGDGEAGHKWKWVDAFEECDGDCDPIKSACPCVVKNEDPIE